MEAEKDNEFNYEGEFTKIEEASDGHIYIAGICTTEKMDHDGEIVDLNEVRSVWNDYMQNPVLKYMHGKDPHNMSAIGKVVPDHIDAEGKTWKTEFTDQGPFIVCKISNAPDTESIRTKVTEGILKGFSIGGRARRVKTFDPTLQKDVNRVITTRISEVSLVDLPANSDSFFSVLKAACEGPDCPLNDNMEPIEKTEPTEIDPIVDQAVAKFEEILLENTEMKDTLSALEVEIQVMKSANDPDTIVKGEGNENKDHISTLEKNVEVDDQLGGINMENEDGIVRMEVPELEQFISDTVTKMAAEADTLEKLEDYDRLVREIKDMRAKIEGLEAQAKANAKALPEGKQMAMKSEGEVEDGETVEKAAKKKDKEPEKEYDEDGNEIVEENDMKIKKMEAEIAELKSSPLYKAQQEEVKVEKTETEQPSGILAGVIAAHYGGN